MPKIPHQAKDTAWKDILDCYFQEFVEFCLPDLYGLIDWDKPWVNLDKELHAISKSDVTGKRVVDKLFQVHLKDGHEQWVLVHLEVENRKAEIFPKRMLVYSYRIFDKYQKLVVSCAILTDTNRHWRPDHYEVALAGSKLRLDYRVIKLLDYRGQEEALDASPNIFASVILSHLAAQSVKKRSDKERAQVKYDLTKRLYRKGYSKDQVLKLYLFIDWMLHLSEPDEIEYKDAVYQLEAEQHMAYISTIERMGIKQGESKLLLRQLLRKFTSVPENYQKKLLSADDEQLLCWGDRVLDANSIDEVFEQKIVN